MEESESRVGEVAASAVRQYQQHWPAVWAGVSVFLLGFAAVGGAVTAAFAVGVVCGALLLCAAVALLLIVPITPKLINNNSNSNNSNNNNSNNNNNNNNLSSKRASRSPNSTKSMRRASSSDAVAQQLLLDRQTPQLDTKPLALSLSPPQKAARFGSKGGLLEALIAPLPQSVDVTETTEWLNTMIKRAFLLLQTDSVSSAVRDAVRAKLDALQLPGFLSPIQLLQLSFVGARPPRINSVRCCEKKAERSLRFEFDFSFDGPVLVEAAVDLLLDWPVKEFARLPTRFSLRLKTLNCKLFMSIDGVADPELCFGLVESPLVDAGIGSVIGGAVQLIDAPKLEQVIMTNVQALIYKYSAATLYVKLPLPGIREEPEIRFEIPPELE